MKLPQGYRLDWGGEYSEYTASRAQLATILPLTLLLIFLLLFVLYRNFKFPAIALAGVLISAPVGGILALWLTGTPFSVSSGIGFLALFGVSVQTALVYISYVNELRRGGTPLVTAIREGAILRLRPIMMTALVAALGLLPAALATRCRHRHPAAVCRGHRRRPGHLPSDHHLPDARALFNGRARRRSTGGLAAPVGRLGLDARAAILLSEPPWTSP